MNTRIPATVITGFLGSGKTTLIRHIISHAAGKRLALIVNEFGDIGMDAAMLGDCAAEGCQIDDIIELANGCICCTVADDFLPSMQKLLEQRPLPDHIIIETSGLALPQPLVQAFNWPDIRAQVMLDGVITLVDGPALASGSVAHDMAALEAQRAADEELDHDSPIDELFKDQIGAANMIVLSKADQLDAAGEASARAVIESHLAGPTPIIVAANGVAPMDAILGLDMEEQAHERASHSLHHHHHDDDHPRITIITITIITIMAMMRLHLSLSPCQTSPQSRRLSCKLPRLPVNLAFCAPRVAYQSMARHCLWWCRQSANALIAILPGRVMARLTSLS